MKTFLLASLSLWQREMVRFVRQPSRVVGALVPPVIFWFLIGSGLGSSFRVPGLAMSAAGSDVNYMQFFFPGTIALILLFTSIFSTISIIEDRHEGFLQAVLVAPLSRLSIVLGKILGGTSLAFLHALPFVLLAPLIGIRIPADQVLPLIAVLVLVSFALTGLGFFLAWRLDSSQGFHAIMNLFLIPMWLLSGALFPLSSAPTWLRWVMNVNPLTYGLSALQHSFHVNGQPLAAVGTPSWTLSLVVSLLFAVCMFGASVVSTREP